VVHAAGEEGVGRAAAGEEGKGRHRQESDGRGPRDLRPRERVRLADRDKVERRIQWRRRRPMREEHSGTLDR